MIDSSSTSPTTPLTPSLSSKEDTSKIKEKLADQLSDLSKLMKDCQQIINNLGQLKDRIDKSPQIKDSDYIKEKLKQGKLLKSSIEEIQRISKGLASSSDSLSTNELSLVFEIENLFRKVLKIEKDEDLGQEELNKIKAEYGDHSRKHRNEWRKKYDFPGKKECQEIYEKAILPLAQQAKKIVQQRPIQSATQAAASKGKALQAGLHALKIRSSDNPVLDPSGVSAQQVFLLGPEKAVLKKSSKRIGDEESRADEEERNANSLFDIMSPQSTVGTFLMKKTSLPRFGIELSRAEKERGYPLDYFDSLDTTLSKLKQKILAKLPSLTKVYKSTDKSKSPDKTVLIEAQKLAVEKLESQPTPVNAKLKNYVDVSQQEWSIKLSDTDKWQEISFQDLQSFYIRELLGKDVRIAPTSDLEKGLSLDEHVLAETPLSQALNYFPALEQPSSGEVYLTPDLSDPEIRKTFELAEQCRWSYTDGEGDEHEVNFKTFLYIYLLDERMNNVRAIPPSESFPVPSDEEILKALDVNWKVMSSDLTVLDAPLGKTPKVTGSLSHIQAKPLIEDMILMTEYPLDVMELFLKKLTPNAKINSILTGEVQLLDLHAANLGLVPVSTPEYERFKGLKFELGTGPITFKELRVAYLQKKIKDSTPIQFEENGKTFLGSLKNFPQLIKALDGSFELGLFDTDLSLSESNYLQFQIIGGKKEHLIPLRSTLLQTKWKDLPLGEKVVEQLLDSTDRDHRVRDWMAKADAPIYKRLSKKAKEDIEKLIKPMVEGYSLTQGRTEIDKTTGKSDKYKTGKMLQKDFSSSISDLDKPGVTEIWKIIEEDLSSVVIREGDTLESIAKRHHQKIEDLKELNPSIKLVPGEKIKIKYDLQSKTAAAEKRRKQIASQLFPRLTVRQQEALIERQTRRTEYLKSYQKLIDPSLSNEDLLKQMGEMITQSASPLSSLEREELLEKLEKVSASKKSDDILELADSVLDKFTPTYFNLMKVMFPLLADTYALNLLLYGESEAGVRIGHFGAPLEQLIGDGLKKPIGSPERRLAEILQKDIATFPAAFFRS